MSLFSIKPWSVEVKMFGYTDERPKDSLVAILKTILEAKPCPWDTPVYVHKYKSQCNDSPTNVEVCLLADEPQTLIKCWKNTPAVICFCPFCCWCGCDLEGHLGVVASSVIMSPQFSAAIVYGGRWQGNSITWQMLWCSKEQGVCSWVGCDNRYPMPHASLTIGPCSAPSNRPM